MANVCSGCELKRETALFGARLVVECASCPSAMMMDGEADTVVHLSTEDWRIYEILEALDTKARAAVHDLYGYLINTIERHDAAHNCARIESGSFTFAHDPSLDGARSFWDGLIKPDR